MAITLNQLVDQVREELLAPRQVNTPEAMYPFLFVEEVELEVSVTVSSSIEGTGKVNIKVAEIGGGVDKANEQTHHVKVKMTPLMTKDEIRERLKQNQRVWERIEQTAVPALAKEAGMVGTE
jgi:hypothetical protein